MGICFVALGLVDRLSKKELIVFFSVLLRITQGAASAFIQTTCYAIAINDYPDAQEAMIGYIEAVTGAGLIVGPLIGSAFYTYFGFELTFYIYGLSVLVIGVFVTANLRQIHFEKVHHI